MLILTFMSLVSSCNKRQPPPELDTAWSPAQIFPSFTRTVLAELEGKPLLVDGNDYYFLEADGSNWTKRTFVLPVNIPNAVPQFDPASSRFILHDGNRDKGNVRDGQLEARIVACSLDPTTGVRTIFDRSLRLDTDALLGSNRTPTCEISFPPQWKQYGPPEVRPQEGRLGGSLMLGNEAYVAYSVECGSVYGSNLWVNSTGPNQSGLLYGPVDNADWKKLKLLDFDTTWHDVFATTENLYFLAGTGSSLEKGLKPGLRSVRIPRKNKAQAAVEIVAPHFYSGSCMYAAVADRTPFTWLG